MEPWAYAIISVLLVSCISLVGVFTLPFGTDRIKKVTHLLVSFAAGALFGDAFIHLLPESFALLGSGLSTSLYVMLGIVVFFSLEKFLRWRHCHIPTSKEHLHPVATMNIVGDAVHNLLDCVIIGASYLVSIPIGITTTLAVVLHEIPQEIGEFGVLVHAGASVKKALALNLLSALVAVIGTLLSLAIGPRMEAYTLALLPVTAGGFLYIAGSDLIPEMHHETDAKASLWQLFFMLLGVGVMALLIIIE